MPDGFFFFLTYPTQKEMGHELRPSSLAKITPQQPAVKMSN